MRRQAEWDSFESPREPWVLICEDSQSDREALSSFLRSEEYQVLEASNGETALAQIKQHEVDLVLLDLHMPGSSGFDVLAYLQEHRRGLPVIVTTGLSPEEIQPHIHPLPIHQLPVLVLKPIDPDKLLTLIDLVLNEQLPMDDPTSPQPKNGS